MDGQRRGKGSATCARTWIFATGLLASACAEPTIDVVALWVDGVSDNDGNRRVRIYEAGERDVFAVLPDIPGTSVDLMQVGVDSRAQGVAVSGPEATVWVERGSGRRVTLSAAAVGREDDVAPGFSFTRSGDGMLRGIEADTNDTPEWLFASFTGPAALQVRTVSPSRPTAQQWSLHHAADAPVLIWAEVAVGPSRVAGDVQAVAYPSDVGQGPWVEDLRPLGRGTMFGREVTDEDAVGFLSGCPDRLCVSPSGRQVFAMTPGDGCDVLRWSWVEAESTGVETPPERVALPCPGGDRAELAAVLGDDLVVLDDLYRLYLLDLRHGSVSSMVKPSGVLVPYLAGRGRVLIVTSSGGELVRVDASGPRMVSGIQTPCVFPSPPAVSPSGGWVVQSCNGQSGSSSVDGQVRRSSVLGVELYPGIPMLPIAVDDEGNALLYSISPSDDDMVPRGLFVLTGDGQLTRVDELEPFPGRVMISEDDGDQALGRFSAAGPA